MPTRHAPCLCAPRLARIGVVLLSAALASCAGPADPQYFSGPTMGTTYHVTLTRLPRQVSREQVQAVVDEVLDDVDRRFSTWRNDSELARFNTLRGTQWVPVSDDLLAVVTEAQRVAAASHGAFDVTVAPLVDVWGFGRDGSRTTTAPDARALHDARDDVGYALLEVQDAPPALRKHRPGLRLDVSGIAPGFAVDRIAARLQRLQVRDAMVELGGEVRAWGRNPDGVPWRVAVEAPLSGERRVYAVVPLDGQSVSTSGDYRDFRIVAGRRISHTVDPRSGRPVEHGLASVTVVDASAMTADAYATALMVLGPEEGWRFAAEHQIAAMLLERVPGAPGWRERVTPQFARLRPPGS